MSLATTARAALGAVRRNLLWIALLVAAAVGARARLLAPVAVETDRVTRGALVEEVFGRGTIESQREAAVGFDLVGRLRDVLVDEGARVTLGQELARLETTQASADFRSAQTGIAAARASLQRLAADEARTRAVLVAAEREAARAQGLFATGSIATQQRDESDDRLRIARADLDRVLAQRAEATRGIDVAAGGAEQRRVAMVRATLLAPFDGLVTRRLREPGDTVSVGPTVLRLVDTGQVYVRAAVDETALARLRDEQRATMVFPGDAAAVPGRVTRVSWEADRQTHELLVDVTPDRLDRRVAIGQRADVRIELSRREGVLRVPVRMVHRDAAGPYVYVDRGGRVAMVRPRLGAVGGDHVEALGGLSEGDTLLAAPRGVAPLPVGRRWVRE
jgi:HlyD family secretion protein